MDVNEAQILAADPASARLEPVRVEGKFFFVGQTKLFLKGVTYGPFPVGEDGTQFPPAERVRQDFAMMAQAGINTARVFTVPPVWLLDIAAENGLRVLAGIPWSQHVTFLDSEQIKAEIRRIGDGRRARPATASGAARLSADRRNEHPAGHDRVLARAPGRCRALRSRA